MKRNNEPAYHWQPVWKLAVWSQAESIVIVKARAKIANPRSSFLVIWKWAEKAANAQYRIELYAKALEYKLTLQKQSA